VGDPPDTPDNLLIEFGQLRRAEGRTLDFELDRWRVQVSEPLLAEATLDGRSLTIKVTNSDDAGAPGSVAVFHAEEDPDNLLINAADGVIVGRAVAGHDRIVQLNAVGPGAVVELSVLVGKPKTKQVGQG
jgi:hypothetical protein